MRKSLVPVFVLVFLFASACTAFAASVTLRWDRNNEPDLAKYTAFWKAPSDSYARDANPPRHHDITVLVVNSTTMTEHPNEVIITVPGNEWEFVLTATDDTGNESGYSNQVDIIKPQPPGNLTIWEVIYAIVKKVLSWFFA